MPRKKNGGTGASSRPAMPERGGSSGSDGSTDTPKRARRISTSGLTKKLFEECALSERKLGEFAAICGEQTWLVPPSVSIGNCWSVAIVEKRLPRFATAAGRQHTTVDLFGCFDLVAVRAGVLGVTGIQATSIGHMSHRFRKIVDLGQEIGPVKKWLLAGNRIIVIGFEMKSRVKKIKIRQVFLADLKKEVGQK